MDWPTNATRFICPTRWRRCTLLHIYTSTFMVSLDALVDTKIRIRAYIRFDLCYKIKLYEAFTFVSFPTIVFPYNNWEIQFARFFFLHYIAVKILVRQENLKKSLNKYLLLFTVVPILHLQLGSNMNPDDIEEGDDVYFECKVHANPGAYKVVWKHNVSPCIKSLNTNIYILLEILLSLCLCISHYFYFE